MAHWPNPKLERSCHKRAVRVTSLSGGSIFATVAFHVDHFHQVRGEASKVWGDAWVLRMGTAWVAVNGCVPQWVKTLGPGPYRQTPVHASRQCRPQAAALFPGSGTVHMVVLRNTGFVAVAVVVNQGLGLGLSVDR